MVAGDRKIHPSEFTAELKRNEYFLLLLLQQPAAASSIQEERKEKFVFHFTFLKLLQ
jgi:hypothetical protein